MLYGMFMFNKSLGRKGVIIDRRRELFEKLKKKIIHFDKIVI